VSHGRAIDPLPLDQFPTEQDSADPGFEQLFSDLVSNAATPTDGFDDAVTLATSLLDSLDAGLASMGGQTGGTLDDAFADMDALDPAPAGEDVVNLSAAIPDLSTNVDNLGTILGGAPLPGPVPGGGGTRPSTCGSLDLGNNPYSVAGQANFVPVKVGLTNNFTTPLTVKSTTWTPAQTFGFQVNPPIDGAVIQPGAQLTLTIVASNGGVGTTQATLTVNTDGPDPQPCLNVTAEWTPAAGVGGGSPITNCVKCADWACPPT
jgi:hypothetical protein